MVNSKVIVALDNMSEAEIKHFLREAQGRIKFIKIGLELFCRYGKEWTQNLVQNSPYALFLDLKLHDIPNTVAKAIESLQGLPLHFLTLHLSAGRGSLEAAIKAQEKFLPECQLLGVSYLTSLDQNDFRDLYALPSEQIDQAFTHLFKLAANVNLGGLVCSAHEVALARQAGHTQSTIVCPGIRFQDEIDSASLGDQKRVLDPAGAVALGADYLVMGRSLVQAKNLKQRLDQLEEMGLL